MAVEKKIFVQFLNTISIFCHRGLHFYFILLSKTTPWIRHWTRSTLFIIGIQENQFSDENSVERSRRVDDGFLFRSSGFRFLALN